MAKKTTTDDIVPKRLRISGTAPTWDELDERLRSEVAALLSAEDLTVEALMKIARLASTWRIYRLACNEDRRAEEIHAAKLEKIAGGGDVRDDAVPVQDRIKMLYGMGDESAG